MLSKRLTMVLSLIEPCDRMADIGTDHGYLALEVLKKGIAQAVIAADVRPGPLKQAQKTFAQANVFDAVEYVLSDGLSSIEDPIDAIVICGMGADLIMKIIRQDLERFKTMKQIILQANTKLPTLRRGMNQLGFTLKMEKIVKDGFYYIAQHYVYTGLCEVLNEFQTHFGVLLDLNDPQYIAYLEEEKDKLEYILSQTPVSVKHQRLADLIQARLNKRIN